MALSPYRRARIVSRVSAKPLLVVAMLVGISACVGDDVGLIGDTPDACATADSNDASAPDSIIDSTTNAADSPRGDDGFGGPNDDQTSGDEANPDAPPSTGGDRGPTYIAKALAPQDAATGSRSPASSATTATPRTSMAARRSAPKANDARTARPMSTLAVPTTLDGATSSRARARKENPNARSVATFMPAESGAGAGSATAALHLAIAEPKTRTEIARCRGQRTGPAKPRSRTGSIPTTLRPSSTALSTWTTSFLVARPWRFCTAIS